MSREEIQQRILKLQEDIQRLDGLKGKQRKKGTAFVIKEKQETISYLLQDLKKYD
jgi:hypothetical protein